MLILLICAYFFWFFIIPKLFCILITCTFCVVYSSIWKFTIISIIKTTVEPVYYGHLGTSQKCPDYQGVLIFQVSLHDNVSFGTTARCVDYAGIHIFKCPD